EWPDAHLDEVGRVECDLECRRADRLDEVAAVLGVVAVDVALVLVDERYLLCGRLFGQSGHPPQYLVPELSVAAVRNKKREHSNLFGLQPLGGIKRGMQTGQLRIEVAFNVDLADRR